MVSSHYEAFISYRHNERDSAVAAEIQRSLEHYRIPKSLRDRTGIRKIGRIFRDKEELPITSDLAEEIREALISSDFLILICSPAWNESRWCRRELEAFLKTHDRSHVLTVISEGEPEEVVPELLLEEEILREGEDGQMEEVTVLHELLSADYRMPFSRARKEELPRLLSSLLSCPYDELIRRDAAYRTRRLVRWFSAAAVLSLAAIFYLVWSNARIRENYENTLIQQSKNLAAQSEEKRKSGDVTEAVRLALEALPGAEKERPPVTEAEYALTRSLGVYDFP